MKHRLTVICTDDNYSPEQLDFWKQHGVTYPVKDTIYEVANVIRHTTGAHSLFLAEIENPIVPINHPILGVVGMEPGFNIARFVNVNGQQLGPEFYHQFKANKQ